jgi:hypothetical protein
VFDAATVVVLVVVVVVTGAVTTVDVCGFFMQVQIAPTKVEACERMLNHFSALASALRLSMVVVAASMVTVACLLASKCSIMGQCAYQ